MRIALFQRRARGRTISDFGVRQITPRVLRHFPPPRLSRSGFLQLFFHTCPALPRRLLRGTGTAPVGLETYAETIAVALQRPKLPGPIDDAAAHRRPFITLAIWPLYRVLAMTVSNAILRQEIISIWIRRLIMLHCVSWVPIEH